MTGDEVDLLEWDRGLPRKRVAAGVLFFDPREDVLIVEPVYKPDWEIPGGSVEKDESPREGAAREVEEELGLVRPVGRLLVLDWVSPRQGRSEGLMFVYDGGVLDAEDVAGIRLPPDELRGHEFAGPRRRAERMSPLLARRVEAAVTARAQGRIAELADGRPVG